MNLRPAYLLVGILLLSIWALWIRRHWLWLLLGTSMVLLPQGVMELVRPGSFAAWWKNTQAINQLQLGYSAWIVRFDTVPSMSTPQQFFCEPFMAAAQRAPITSPIELAGHLVVNLPQSIDLVAQKMTAWLMWTSSTPFFDEEPRLSPLSVVVSVVVVLGGLGWWQVTRTADLPRPAVVVVLALTLGILGGAITATPEARFAMPLVLLGIAGVGLVQPRAVKLRSLMMLAGLVAIIVLLGYRGLSHPAPPGGVSPEVCATAGAVER